MFTTFPRFLSQQPIEKDVYLKIFGLFFVGSLTFLLGSFVSAFIWVSVLMGVYALAFLISKKFRYDFKNETKKLADRKFLSTVLGISLFDNLGSLFNIWALSLGPVALVFAMEGWQIYVDIRIDSKLNMSTLL